MISLKEVTRSVFIVAHKENTDQLRAFLGVRGFDVQIVRRAYSEREQRYAAQMRCLLSHKDVWLKIAASERPAIVLEADFVPVRGFGSDPAPFDPKKYPVAIGWLYAGGPVLYHCEDDGHAIGHTSTTVGMVVTPAAAERLVVFANDQIEQSAGSYTPWDTYLSHVLRRTMHVPTFLPFRNHGEHGGIPNREHARHGIRSWHQADRLAGPLAFLPPYAYRSPVRYRLISIRANLRGLWRLAAGKYLESLADSRQKGRLFSYTAARWLPGMMLSPFKRRT